MHDVPTLTHLVYNALILFASEDCRGRTHVVLGARGCGGGGAGGWDRGHTGGQTSGQELLVQEAGQEGVAGHHLHPGCVSDVLAALKLSGTK